jgi:hypothetical protein
MMCEPKVKWNKNYKPKQKPLSELLPDEDERPAPPPPVAYPDQDGKITMVKAEWKDGDD